MLNSSYNQKDEGYTLNGLGIRLIDMLICLKV